MPTNNRIVVDLKKVQWALYNYVNQHGDSKMLLPDCPTVMGAEFNAEAMHFNGKDTMLEYATKHNLLDIWTPHLKLKLTANCTLIYTGDKAKSIWKEWCRRVFEKK